MGSQSNDARTPTEKSGRRSNKNSVDPMIGKRSKSGINVMLRRHGNRVELQAELARGWLLSLPKIISGRSYDVIRTELA